WADNDLIASGWYPREHNTAAGRLAYYARHFDLVEVDTSHYAIPDPAVTAGWAARTPPGFTFDVKAFSLFTGQPTRASALPAPAGGRTAARLVVRRRPDRVDPRRAARPWGVVRRRRHEGGPAVVGAAAAGGDRRSGGAAAARARTGEDTLRVLRPGTLGLVA